RVCGDAAGGFARSTEDVRRAGGDDARVWRVCGQFCAAVHDLVQPVQVLSPLRAARQPDRLPQRSALIRCIVLRLSAPVSFLLSRECLYGWSWRSEIGERQL